MTKSPRVIRGALATTMGPGFNKRDNLAIGRTKVLDPIQITEEANRDQAHASSTEELPIATSKQESSEQQKTAIKQ